MVECEASQGRRPRARPRVVERPGGDVVGEFGDPVVGRALGAVVRPGTPAEVAISRVMTRSGARVVLHGVPLAAPGPQRVAVIVEPAHPARISPLLVSAYGLTERRRRPPRAARPPDHAGRTHRPRPRAARLVAGSPVRLGGERHGAARRARALRRHPSRTSSPPPTPTSFIVPDLTGRLGSRWCEQVPDAGHAARSGRTLTLHPWPRRRRNLRGDQSAGDNVGGPE